MLWILQEELSQIGDLCLATPGIILLKKKIYRGKESYISDSVCVYVVIQIYVIVFIFVTASTRLHMIMLECKIEMLEKLIKEMDLRWMDLNVALRNQSSVILELIQRVNALERGTINGLCTAPQYCFYPRGYYATQ